MSLGSFSFRGHLCIALELLSINLYELLQERRMLVSEGGDDSSSQYQGASVHALALSSSNRPRPTTPPRQGCGPTLVRSVAAQVLRSLDTLEATGIVHCDIKPENIMLVDRKHSNVKVCWCMVP